jgi:hypothetical protein
LRFDVYNYRDYKSLLKERAKWIRAHKPSVTLKKIAQRVPMQYTYLSKALNDEQTQLNEDHLFRICRELELLPLETDFVLLLRAHASAQDADRKSHLGARIDTLVKKREVTAAEHREFSMSSDHLMREMSYLLDPLAMIVHLALAIKEFRQDPRRLCAHLGITSGRLKELLRVLHANGLIELGEDPFEIKDRPNKRIHYGKDHPLMRIATDRMKTILHSRLQVTGEEDKESFLVTFTMDDEGFEKAKVAFRKFITELQAVSVPAPSEHLYQMSFDLLKWF